jgi:inosine-uridine nucleoside N-ribohydrolase
MRIQHSPAGDHGRLCRARQLHAECRINIAIDPKAAKVFQSGLDIVMCGLDVTNQAMLRRIIWRRCRA